MPLALCRDLIARQGLSVIFDSPAAYPVDVEQAQRITGEGGGRLKVILCEADVELRGRRMAGRDPLLSQQRVPSAARAADRHSFEFLPADNIILQMYRPLEELLTETLAYLTR